MVAQLVGAAVGAGFGYVCFRLVGCPTGGCPLQSRAWSATLYWAVVGGLVGTLLAR